MTTVDQAKGRLQEAAGWSEERAYQALLLTSQWRGLSIEDVAAEVALAWCPLEAVPSAVIERTEPVPVPRGTLEAIRRRVAKGARWRALEMLDKVLSGPAGSGGVSRGD